MFEFFKNYNKWEVLSVDDKKDTLYSCAKFYEEKTVDYILAYLPENKRRSFSKAPVKLEFSATQVAGKNISFGDNVVHVYATQLLSERKAKLFYGVAKNTIYAVFLNLFNSTANSGSKKTKFSSIADGYFASITNEFCIGQAFEQDMMSVCADLVAEVQMNVN